MEGQTTMSPLTQSKGKEYMQGLLVIAKKTISINTESLIGTVKCQLTIRLIQIQVDYLPREISNLSSKHFVTNEGILRPWQTTLGPKRLMIQDFNLKIWT